MDRRAVLAALLGLALAGCPALAGQDKADGDDGDDDEKSPLAAARFPQPVRVGQLVGRAVLQPLESQPVLGHVRAVVRGTDGTLRLVMSYGGWFGWGAHPIAVPLGDVSLLGEYVVATGATPEQLGRLPRFDGEGTPLSPDEVVHVGLIKPAH